MSGMSLRIPVQETIGDALFPAENQQVYDTPVYGWVGRLTLVD